MTKTRLVFHKENVEPRDSVKLDRRRTNLTGFELPNTRIRDRIPGAEHPHQGDGLPTPPIRDCIPGVLNIHTQVTTYSGYMEGTPINPRQT